MKHIDLRWNSNLAYAIGLITTDGSLSIDGRHIIFTSKDREQIETFSEILQLRNKIGNKKSGRDSLKTHYHIQFSNVEFYRFLVQIGLMPNKTKILGVLKIPDIYFTDFLRGHLDGDGSTYSYWDKRWRSSFMLYTEFASASKSHLEWIQEKIRALYKIEGKITFAGKSTFLLKYAKNSSVALLQKFYYKDEIPCLSRKRFKIEQQLGIIQSTRMWRNW